MDWLYSLFVGGGIAHTVFTLALVITAGILLGKVKVCGISLGITWILFVGIIAAQSIGEPGTQLTMRTFHTGGVAGDDITQGLPRVEELFEARKPKKMAQISEIDGVVDVDDSHRTALRNITITADDGEVKQYQVPYSVGLKVEHGKRVRKGEPITDGALNPHDVLRISGIEAVQDYLTQGVLAVYRQQGVDILSLIHI